MLLPPFDVVEPTTLEGVFQALREGTRTARILAGGTDLVADLKREYDRRARFPDHPGSRPGPLPGKIVSLSRIRALRGVLFPKRGAARIGSMTLIAELLAHPRIRREFGALWDGAEVLGTPQVRNRATFGGNLCNARPCADTAPATIALGGKLELESANRQRRMVEAESFFTGPGETAIAPHEVLAAKHLPVQKKTAGSAYVKLGTRKACEITLVSAAAWVHLESGTVADARIALGSVGPVPILASAAGNVLRGKAPEEAVLLEAAREAVAESKPVNDFRASALYRKRMVRVLTLRALAKAVERAGGRTAAR